ncbi:hypothetical protein VM1G_06676 [Cytospora mali]|uniref:Uncharacterized protein n=1 Tax=Cytospora mali TaxID=578113 RepID=A0A194W564_CYTMA|nr:hypothetical protein VM1G_06676 [Valsa mali]
MASPQPHNDQAAPGDDEMMVQPQVVDLMLQLNQLRRISNRPMSVDEQAQALGKIIERQQAQKRANCETIMAAGEAQFDEAAMEEAVRASKRQRTGSKVDLNDARKMYVYGPEGRPEQIDDAVDVLALDAELLSLSDDFEGEFSEVRFNMADERLSDNDSPTYKPGFNLLESVCSHIWLATEVGKHVRPRDIVNLFSVSKAFHGLIKQHWQSTILAWGEHMAPSSLKVFFWKFYGKYAIQDPTGTTWAAPGPFMNNFPRPAWAAADRAKPCDKTIRMVPGLKYLAMIVERERRVRDILACLARNGHRLPRTAHETLKKIWLLMDISTNNLRRAFIRNENLWRARDLYNAQMFFVKLQLRFNEPAFGPECPTLVETLLGQREGLTPLWRLFRGAHAADPLLEVMQMRVRYCCEDDDAAQHREEWQDYFGVPAWDLGFGHLEGWGEGHVHLSRPDELVVEEAVRRAIGLQDHLLFMVLWGHVDWRNRRNLVPTEDEMYMSDDELPPLAPRRQEGPGGVLGRCGNVPFEQGNWTPAHALKARWDTLTDEEKKALNGADYADAMRMIAWDDEDEGFFDPDVSETPKYHDGGPHEDDCVCEECGGMCTKCGVLHHDGDDDEICCDGDGDGDGEGEDQGWCDIVTAPAGLAEAEPAILAMWDKLTPEQKERIVDAYKEYQAKHRAAGTTAGHDPIKTSYPRDYKISDPTCLALLRKYDVFPHEMFGSRSKGVDEEGKEDEGGDDDADDEMDLDHFDADADGDDVDDDSDDEVDGDYGDDDVDDEALKALADQEYSDEELYLNVDKYKSYLADAREEAGLFYDDPNEDEEEDGIDGGLAHEEDMDAFDGKVPMKMRDTRYC